MSRRGEGLRHCISSHGHEHEFLYGKRFNHLKAISLSQYRPFNSFWLCECSCGRKAVVSYSDLLSGRVRGCGECSHES